MQCRSDACELLCSADIFGFNSHNIKLASNEKVYGTSLLFSSRHSCTSLTKLDHTKNGARAKKTKKWARGGERWECLAPNPSILKKHRSPTNEASHCCNVVHLINRFDIEVSKFFTRTLGGDPIRSK